MQIQELPDERDDSALSIVEDAPAVTYEADERGSARHHEWAAREDNSGEAASLAAQRESRPVDADGNTVLSQAEIDAADGGAPEGDVEADAADAEESDADQLDAQAPRDGI